jgi:hypothetical protein
MAQRAPGIWKPICPVSLRWPSRVIDKRERAR